MAAYIKKKIAYSLVGYVEQLAFGPSVYVYMYQSHTRCTLQEGTIFTRYTQDSHRG